MRTAARRIVAFLAGAVLLILILLGSAVFLVVKDPGIIKPFIESSLGSLTGLEVKIGLLDWSTDPLTIKATALSVQSRPDQDPRLDSELESLELTLRLEGKFGDRTLVIQKGDAEGLALDLEGHPKGFPPQASPSLVSTPARLGARLAGWLLFNEVRVEQVEVKRATVSAALPWGRFKVEEAKAELHALPGHDGGLEKGAEASLSAQQGGFKCPGGEASNVSVSGLAIFDPIGKSLDVSELRARASRIMIRGLEDSLPEETGADINWRGRIDLGGEPGAEGPLELMLLAGEEKISGRGILRTSWGRQAEISLSSIESRVYPSRWIRFFPQPWQEAIQPLRFSGPVSIAGGIRAAQANGGLELRPDLRLELNENPAGFRRGKTAAEALLTGAMTLNGTWPNPDVSLDLGVQGLKAASHGLQISPSELVLELDGSIRELRLTKLGLHVPAISIRETGSRLPVQDVEATAEKGTIRPGERSIHFPEITLKTAELGPFLMGVEARPGLVRADVRGRGTGLVSFLSGEGSPLAGWGADAVDRIRAEARLNKDGLWDLSAELGLEDASFENPGLDAFGEALSFSAELSGSLDPDSLDWSCRADATLNKGEVLLGKFYADLGKNSFRASLACSGRAPAFRTLAVESLGLGLEGIISAKASGLIKDLGRGPAAEFWVEVPTLDLAPAFRMFAAEPLRMDLPFLDRINIQGQISSEARASFSPDGLDVEGRVEILRAGIRSDEPSIGLNGLDLSLPFIYRNNGRGRATGPAPTGSLSVEALEIPPLPVQGVTLPLEAGVNRLLVPHQAEILIPGGVVLLGPWDIELRPGRGLFAETSLILDEMELRPLLSRIWPGSPQGVVTGALDPVSYREGVLSTGGGLEAAAFGGKIMISDISVSGVFSRTPSLHLDARWEDLDLEQITSGTPFGLIRGVLRGWVRDLEFAYGQPQKFELFMETIPVKGVDQRISVKAVDNISRIGGGGSPFAGMAGIFASLFKEFPYEKIGIRASLENDVFKINGTIKEDGKEFLVKRGGLSGVNVVNQNPDNRISFKDMVKRIQRVTDSSQGGPVIQ